MTFDVRHLVTGAKDTVATDHPELFEQHPELINPVLGGADQNFPYLFYALSEGVVASYFASFPDLLFGDDRKTYPWAWNGNLYTNEKFRGRGLAQAIVAQQLIEFGRLGYVWGGVFSSPPALRLYERMGFVVVGTARRLCLVRNIRPFLRHHFSNKPIIAAGGLAFDGLFTGIKLALHHRDAFFKRFYVEKLNRLEFSEVISKYGLTFPECFHWGGTASWIEKRLGAGDSISLIFRGSDPCGFFIMRDRVVKDRPLKDKYTSVRLMSVMEFGRFDSGDDVSEAFVDAALSEFSSSEADMIEFVTSSKEIEAAARSRGFLPIGSGMSFKYMAPPRHSLSSIRTQPSDWHLSHYSGDAFGFE